MRSTKLKYVCTEYNKCSVAELYLNNSRELKLLVLVYQFLFRKKEVWIESFLVPLILMSLNFVGTEKLVYHTSVSFSSICFHSDNFVFSARSWKMQHLTKQITTKKRETDRIFSFSLENHSLSGTGLL